VQSKPKVSVKLGGYEDDDLFFLDEQLEDMTPSLASVSSSNKPVLQPQQQPQPQHTHPLQAPLQSPLQSQSMLPSTGGSQKKGTSPGAIPSSTPSSSSSKHQVIPQAQSDKLDGHVASSPSTVGIKVSTSSKRNGHHATPSQSTDSPKAAKKSKQVPVSFRMAERRIDCCDAFECIFSPGFDLSVTCIDYCLEKTGH
jgi:hypothetical protein